MSLSTTFLTTIHHRGIPGYTVDICPQMAIMACEKKASNDKEVQKNLFCETKICLMKP